MRMLSSWEVGVSTSLLCFFACFYLAIAATGDGKHLLEHSIRGAEKDGHAEEQSILERPELSDGRRYEPAFAALSRSIIGRQGSGSSIQLQNNIPSSAQISPGHISSYVFPSSVLHGPPSSATLVVPPFTKRRVESYVEGNYKELRKRQDDVEFHLTLSVCSQPSPSNATTAMAPPPQLKLFISLTDPQPSNGLDNGAIVPPVEAGFATYSNPTSDSVYIDVQALDAEGYSGSYSYELTGSIDAPYAAVESTPALFLLDSDSNGAMLISTDLTDPDFNNTSKEGSWSNLGPRFTIAVVNQNDTQMAGLMQSYCAFRNNTNIVGDFAQSNSSTVEKGLISTSGEAPPKQQFYVSNLNRSSAYYAVMGIPSNYSTAGSGQPGGGGTIWPAKSFNTQSGESFNSTLWARLTCNQDGNCQVIYNLSFCHQVNYAVPYNPTKQDLQGAKLAEFYDGQAKNWWANFSNALDQIACDTTPDAQYSLAVTCQNCSDAYKEWLCAVSIPRCRDFSSQAPYLMRRAIGYPFYNGTKLSGADSNDSQLLGFNQSRNPLIDQTIQPGPYKELLPCGSICHSLVQKCPAALSFACPSEGKGYSQSYGYPRMDGGMPQCNIPGQIWGVSTGTVLQPSLLIVSLTVLSLSVLLQKETTWWDSSKTG